MSRLTEKPDKHQVELGNKSFGKGKRWRLRLSLLLLPAVGMPASAMADYPPNGPDIPTIYLNRAPRRPERPPPPGPWDQQSQWNTEFVGYDSLDGRSTYQPLIVHQDAREIAYMAHHAGVATNRLTGEMEPNGTSIIDVTNARRPRYLAHVPGPPGSVDAAGSQMVRVCSGDVLPRGQRGKWYMLRTHGNSSGMEALESQEIFDVTDPAHPTFLTTVVGKLSNTHKNWWECDTGIAYLVSGNVPDSTNPNLWHHSGSNQHLKIYDLSDPANPVYIRDFGLVGQEPNATFYEGIVNPPSGIHGPISAGTTKNRVYMAYGVGSNGVFQIVDRNVLLHGCDGSKTCPFYPTTQEMLAPQKGYLTMSPDQGGHSSFPVFGLPIPEFHDFSLNRRDIVILVSEAGGNFCEEAPHLAFLVDVTNESTPFPISTLRVPEFPGDFCNKGGRFGSHAVAESFYPPYYGKLAIISWFTAGVRIFDIRDPFDPEEVGYFIPAPNENTIATCDPAGRCAIAIQTNNVEVDDRGLIYLADRAGTGMHIVKLTGHARRVVEP